MATHYLPINYMLQRQLVMHVKIYFAAPLI